MVIYIEAKKGRKKRPYLCEEAPTKKILIKARSKGKGDLVATEITPLTKVHRGEREREGLREEQIAYLFGLCNFGRNKLYFYTSDKVI